MLVKFVVLIGFLVVLVVVGVGLLAMGVLGLKLIFG